MKVEKIRIYKLTKNKNFKYPRYSNMQKINQSFYLKIGGSATISAMIPIMIEKVKANPDVFFYFKGLKIEKIVDVLVASISILFGAISNWKGKSFKIVHKNFKITEEAYLGYQKCLTETMYEIGVPQKAIDHVISNY